MLTGVVLFLACVSLQADDHAARGFGPAATTYEGFGAWTKGGDAGEVVAVTTLEDSGPGSLREALRGSNRKIVFKVGGSIRLKSQLTVKGQNVTIAGETARAPGITLEGHGMVILNASDIIVRHLRFRKGLNANLRIAGRGSRNIVIDRCSFSKGNDRNLIINSGPRDVTISWCVFADCNKGMLLYDASRLSIHHCVFTNHHQRNPQLSNCKQFDLRNNYIRNWGYYGVRVRDGSTGNVVDNVIGSVEHQEKQPNNALVILGTSGPVHVSGNQGPDRSNINNNKGRAAKPFEAPQVNAIPVAQLPQTLLTQAGAQPHDEIDRQYLKDRPELKPSLRPRPGKIKRR